MEKRINHMNQCINKAVNQLEIPVKEKHVRSAIIGTFQEKGAGTFWAVAQRLPLEANRIVAWKFCHVLHKVLREGHFNCLQQSQRHRDLLKNLGKLWVHLKEGYGKLIQLYTNLLITKIDFHERNPNFPGNLVLTSEELDTIGNNDINIFFQLSVEMFDYMDDVLALQGAIFDLFESPHTSSMTSSGQCRLAPLIPCIQDSNQLYDFSVKLLFKLHSMLPADTLAGHRERFFNQFKLLKKFYQCTDNMQYFKNLISTPSLSEKPPNFLSQSEFTSYRPPVVVLPPEEQFDNEQDLIGNLVDTSDTNSQFSPDAIDVADYNGTQSSSTSELLIQRDSLIGNLQAEISRLRNERENISSEYKATIASMNDQISLMENKYALAKLELEQVREQYQEIKNQLSQPATPVVDHTAEDKVKETEEKYQKLKTAYLQMREEHITLLRQNAETSKQVGVLKKLTSEQEANAEVLQTTINKLERELSNISEIHLQNSNDIKSETEIVRKELLETIEAYKQEKEYLMNDLDIMKNERNEIETKYKNENADLKKALEDSQNCSNDLAARIEELKSENQKMMLNEIIHQGDSETLKKSLEDSYNHIQKTKDELECLDIKYKTEKAVLENLLDNSNKNNNDLSVEIEALKEENRMKLFEINETFKRENDELKNSLKTSQNEFEKIKSQLEELGMKYEDEKSEMKREMSEIYDSNNNLTTEIEDLKSENKNMQNRLEWSINEKLNLESELQDLIQSSQTLEESLSKFPEKLAEAENELKRERENFNLLLWSFMKCSIRSASDIIKGTIDEFENPAISSLQCGPDYFRSLLPLTEEALTKFEASLKNFESCTTPSENIANDIVKVAHLLNSVIIQGVATSNTSKDIVFGEKMAQECKELAFATSNCIRYVELFDVNVKQNGAADKSKECISNIRKLVESISKLAGSVGGQDNVDSSDSLEVELANMDKTIEEAASKIEEMLRASRAADSGLKLEVNEKILDACTSLMAAIRELVKKSRDLQGEIVTLHKGNNSTKEFYKRNHQWADGLISAAKAVALGATLLLASADKVVTSGGKLEHVMVAAQEIAASTAQLVVASRVRASRGSTRLQALSVASRSVSSATGAVVATAKSCAQLVEDSEELDMSGISLAAGRRMEMESQVRVLELEQALVTERLKLASLRRTNYRLADSEINANNKS